MHHWKTRIVWTLIFLLCLSYGYLQWLASPSATMRHLREQSNRAAEAQRQKISARESRIAAFYQRADQNLAEGVFYLDSILRTDTTLDKWEKSDLHKIIGETLYDHDSIDQALQRFVAAESLTLVSPGSLANKAGCYVKKGDYETAMTLLEQAARTNQDYLWYIGNLYEVMNNREKAIQAYMDLYRKNTGVYGYSADRAREIEKPGSKLWSALVYEHGRERWDLLFQPVDPDSKGLEVGRFEWKKAGDVKQ